MPVLTIVERCDRPKTGSPIGVRSPRERLVRTALKGICRWRRVTHVAMEGTGAYWVPAYAGLEDTRSPGRQQRGRRRTLLSGATGIDEEREELACATTRGPVMLAHMETETKPRLRLPAVLAVAVVAAPLMSGCGGNTTPANDAGQADAQVAGVALEHADHSASDVMQYFVAATETFGVHRRSVVLQIDPARDDHWCGHDQLQNLQVRVLSMVVAVHERAACQVQPRGSGPRRDDECGVTGETPFRSHFRPVLASSKHVLFR